MCCEDMHDMLTEYLAGQDSKFPETDEQFNQIVQLFSSQLVEFQQDLDRTEQQMFTKSRTSGMSGFFPENALNSRHHII